MRFKLERVLYMPKELSPGVLYFAESFGAAAHLCACGCGAKIRTPIGPVEWALDDSGAGPSLSPSVGNSQQACRSHYWITDGEVVWAKKLTSKQAADGWRFEEQRRQAYYTERKRPVGIFGKLRGWLIKALSARRRKG